MVNCLEKAELQGNAAELVADPLADDTIAAILGSELRVEGVLAARGGEMRAAPWRRIAEVNRLIAQWRTNADVADWQAPRGTTPEVAVALQNYLRSAHRLPDWADEAKIARAESVFMDFGALSCVLLFCSSLPECYVIPSLASVLQETGQLERRTEYRIRSTAGMIFPVMLEGGLTSPEGGGVAQVLKVRLIHAMIRHLILRGSPQSALQSVQAGKIPALALTGDSDAGDDMSRALFSRGWDTEVDGLPCNQQELAYTLLTFHYVFLRSLRRLGLGVGREDEEAYLHAWNVVGHLLGIDASLTAPTMDEAKSLFDGIRARGKEREVSPDPRPPLASALMKTMEDVIPWRLVRPFPRLMTRYLCRSRLTIRSLGLNGPVALLSQVAFFLGMGFVRLVDTVVRIFVPGFSISRLLTRIVGYQFMAQVLMDQTRPLKLPPALLTRVAATMDTWQTDPKAPQWANTLEERLRRPGRVRGARREA